MRSYEERREERREYEADVHYDAWRRGCGDIDPDRIYDAYYEGLPAEGLVDRVVHERQQQRQMDEQDYYEQQEEQ